MGGKRGEDKQSAERVCALYMWEKSLAFFAKMWGSGNINIAGGGGGGRGRPKCIEHEEEDVMGEMLRRS